MSTLYTDRSWNWSLGTLLSSHAEKSKHGDPPIFLQFYTRKGCIKVMLKMLSFKITFKKQLSVRFHLKNFTEQFIIWVDVQPTQLINP